MSKERQLRNDIDCHVSLQAPNLEERKHFGEEYSISCPSLCTGAVSYTNSYRTFVT